MQSVQEFISQFVKYRRMQSVQEFFSQFVKLWSNLLVIILLETIVYTFCAFYWIIAYIIYRLSECFKQFLNVTYSIQVLERGSMSPMNLTSSVLFIKMDISV